MLDKNHISYYIHSIAFLRNTKEIRIMENQPQKIDWRSKFAKDQVLTIPNMLSFLRILLIIPIVWLYWIDQPIWALAFVILSGLTDVIDGFIARKFHMVTDLGKALDPVADKLTQGIILIALLIDFPWMWLPFSIMVVKEITSFTLRLIAFRKTQIVNGAQWHGKLTTVVLYLIMALHMVWVDIPPQVSFPCIVVASSLMILSFILYTIDVIIFLKKHTPTTME